MAQLRNAAFIIYSRTLHFLAFNLLSVASFYFSLMLPLLFEYCKKRFKIKKQDVFSKASKLVRTHLYAK
jgi:hypothetical protein